MKLNSLRRITAIFLCSTLVYSCCDCQETDVFVYEGSRQILDLNLLLIDNSQDKAKIVPSQNNTSLDSINKNAFGLRLDIGNSYELCDKQVECSYLFFPTAYACNCDDDYYNYWPSNYCTVKDFKIFTLNDFDSVTKAGDEITNYFREFNPRSKVMRALEQDSIALVISGDLLLMEAPTLSKIHQFAVHFTTSDTTFLKDTTPQVILF